MPNRRLSLPWPHRCPECQHWTLGTLEGITRIRFDVCPPCTIGDDTMSHATCPRCGDADTWFDRSICPCDQDDEYGGVMHTRCATCGLAVDECAFESGWETTP